MNNSIQFHFKGGLADTNSLPVDYVINLLEGVRDLTYLTLAQEAGIVVSQRLRLPKNLKERVKVVCNAARPGSYVQTLTFEDPNSLEELLREGEKVCGQIKQLFASAANAMQDRFKQIFPNPTLRLKAYDSLRKALPAKGSIIYFEVDANEALNSKVMHTNTENFIVAERAVAEEHMTAVTGRLTGIDFDAKKMFIQYPVTRKSLDCFYNEAIEDMLLENRRDLVQVVGNVLLDDNEQPIRITNAISIQEVDLSPIEINTVEYDDVKLKLKQPLDFVPMLDDSVQLLTLCVEELGIDIFAYTRDELIEDLKSELVLLWQEYACANDDDLTDGATAMKAKLLSILEQYDEQ